MPIPNEEDLDDVDFLEVGGNPVEIKEHEGVTTAHERDFVADTGDDSAEDDESEDADDADRADEGAEDAETDTEGAELGAEGVEPGKKPKQTAKERIAELVKRAKEAEKAAFEAEMALIAERDRAKTAPAAETPLAEPRADDFRYGEVDPAYIDAVVEFRVAKQAREIAARGAESADQARVAAENARYAARLNQVLGDGKKKHADFEEVVNSVQFDASLARMVLDSDKAVDIGYFLSNNIGKLREITRLDAAGRARAIGQLEGRFSVASAARKTTKAPEPITGKRTKPARTGDEAKYGPKDPNEFDKAFLS
jgi:hypothetical protein